MQRNTRRAIITGATSGIGEATALRFAVGGYDLVICGRRAERLQKLAAKLKELGSKNVIPLSFDIQNYNETKEALSMLPSEWRSPNLLVNNAGLALGANKIDEGDISDWETMIDTNIKGLLYVTTIVSAWMIANGNGHIINIGSIAGKEVYPGGNVYCATKHAVDALTKAMRIDMIEKGIKVSQIAPAATETEFALVRYKGDLEKAKQVYQGFTPLRGSDIAEIAWFVAQAPPQVNVADVLVLPSAQGSSTIINRNK